jgi:hypothetical protein
VRVAARSVTVVKSSFATAQHQRGSIDRLS